MTDPEHDHLTEEEAARLWKRAAELQAAAARASDDAPQPDDAGDEAEAEASTGYAVAHVRSAALEAGIESHFVDAALVELSAERVLPAPPSGVVDGLGRRFLGEPPDHLEASRLIRATPEEVVAAMERVFPRVPYNLVLKDRRGAPASGATLVFDIDGAGFLVTEGWTGQASWADMREVYAFLLPGTGTDRGCELTIRSPVAWARSLNLAFGTAITGVTGLMGMGVGTVVGESVAALLGAGGILPAALVALVAVLGVLAGAGVATGAYRLLYGDALNRGRRALNTLLSQVAMEAEGGWGFDRLADGNQAP